MVTSLYVDANIMFKAPDTYYAQVYASTAQANVW